MRSSESLRSPLQILGCEPLAERAREETIHRRVAGFGLALYAAAIVWIAQIAIDLDIERWWPIGVVAGGIALMFMAPLVRRHGWEWATIVGAAIATTGTILFYQVMLGRWESWAYAWPLVLPASLGFAAILSVATRGVSRAVGLAGLKLLSIGVFMYFVGFLFFEGVLGIGNLKIEGQWSVLLPLSLFIVGIALIAWRWPTTPSP